MFGENELFERAKPPPGGLEEDEDFAVAFEFALPPVVGFEFGNEIGAGNESGAERGAGKGAGGLEIGCGDENDGEVARGFHWEKRRMFAQRRQADFPDIAVEVAQVRGMFAGQFCDVPVLRNAILVFDLRR